MRKNKIKKVDFLTNRDGFCFAVVGMEDNLKFKGISKDSKKTKEILIPQDILTTKLTHGVGNIIKYEYNGSDKFDFDYDGKKVAKINYNKLTCRCGQEFKKVKDLLVCINPICVYNSRTPLYKFLAFCDTLMDKNGKLNIHQIMAYCKNFVANTSSDDTTQLVSFHQYTELLKSITTNIKGRNDRLTGVLASKNISPDVIERLIKLENYVKSNLVIDDFKSILLSPNVFWVIFSIPFINDIDYTQLTLDHFILPEKLKDLEIIISKAKGKTKKSIINNRSNISSIVAYILNYGVAK